MPLSESNSNISHALDSSRITAEAFDMAAGYADTLASRIGRVISGLTELENVGDPLLFNGMTGAISAAKDAAHEGFKALHRTGAPAYNTPDELNDAVYALAGLTADFLLPEENLGLEMGKCLAEVHNRTEAMVKRIVALYAYGEETQKMVSTLQTNLAKKAATAAQTAEGLQSFQNKPL